MICGHVSGNTIPWSLRAAYVTRFEVQADVEFERLEVSVVLLGFGENCEDDERMPM